MSLPNAVFDAEYAGNGDPGYELDENQRIWIPRWVERYDVGDIVYADGDAIYFDKPGVYSLYFSIVLWTEWTQTCNAIRSTFWYEIQFGENVADSQSSLVNSGGANRDEDFHLNANTGPFGPTNYIGGPQNATIEVGPDDLGKTPLRLGVGPYREHPLFDPDLWFYYVYSGADWTWTFVRVVQWCATPRLPVAPPPQSL